MGRSQRNLLLSPHDISETGTVTWSGVPVSSAAVRKYFVHTGRSNVRERAADSYGTDLPTIPGFEYLRNIQ